MIEPCGLFNARHAARSTPQMRSGIGHLDEVNRYIVEDHCRNPRNVDPITDFNAEASIDNPFCGDEVRVQIRVEQDRVSAICVHGTGCAITQASASMMGEAVEGKHRSEIADSAAIMRRMLTEDQELDDDEAEVIGDSISLRGVSRFPIRIKCALLAWATLEDAIDSLDG